MLYIVYGKDREKVRTQFRALRDTLTKESGDVRQVGEGEAMGNFLDEAIASSGLFGGTTLFVLDGVFEKKADQEVLESRIGDLVSSPNIFLVVELSLEKSIIESAKDLGATIKECAGGKADFRPEFNIFSLGDALGKRSKKDLWVLYRSAVEKGFESEEICGTLFWAVKNLALMKQAKAGDDAGLNSFVATKTRGFAKNYTEDEIKNLSRGLTTLYHEAHRGGEPMDIALERFVLSI